MHYQVDHARGYDPTIHVRAVEAESLYLSATAQAECLIVAGKSIHRRVVHSQGRRDAAAGRDGARGARHGERVFTGHAASK